MSDFNNFRVQRRGGIGNYDGAYYRDTTSMWAEEYVEEETYGDGRYYGSQYGAIGGNNNGGGYNSNICGGGGNRYNGPRGNGNGGYGYGGRGYRHVEDGRTRTDPAFTGIEIGSNNRTAAGANEVKLRFDLSKLKDVPERNGGVLIGSQQFATENDNRIDFSEYDDSQPQQRRA